MAITSLVLGIAAFPAICCYGVPAVVLGVAAVILGRISLRRIRESGGALGGHGMAQAGWITGLVGGSLGLIYGLITVGFVILTFFLTFFSAANGIGNPSPSP
ncbi:MAG TPA: hypothetical protein VHW94_06720 [Candidatus Dormibacteraeota bacterium]|nr:hypothetical protein [Candidatus Dormibacteraeota bacterium]